MVNLPSVSSAEVLRVLRKAGFIDAPHRGKGSHVALYHVAKHGRRSHFKSLPRQIMIQAIVKNPSYTTSDLSYRSDNLR